MSLLSYIERLRKAPFPERRKTAATWTIAIVIIVALVWLAMLGFRFGLFSDPAGPPRDAPEQDSGIAPPYR